MTSRAAAVSEPTIIRSGRIKSEMAAPSRKNSGFDTTSKSASAFAFATILATLRPVPTGTVDFVTITVYPDK